MNDAKFITPQLGELPTALAARMSDSNANLIQQALNIGQSLATSMGPSCRQHVRTLLPGFLQALSVNKVFELCVNGVIVKTWTWNIVFRQPQVRASAVSCLNTWVEQCNGMKEFFEGEMIAEALNKGNPYVKADLLTWLADKLPNGMKLSLIIFRSFIHFHFFHFSSFIHFHHLTKKKTIKLKSINEM